eukprot:gene13809-18523_t
MEGVEEKVYVSLTTISDRIDEVNNTIVTILRGTVVPDKIFLIISTEPHLIDEGVQIIPNSLLALATIPLFSIIFTNNIGPHRKLLPILDHFWDHNNTIIITIDDDLGLKKKNEL